MGANLPTFLGITGLAYLGSTSSLSIPVTITAGQTAFVHISSFNSIGVASVTDNGSSSYTGSYFYTGTGPTAGTLSGLYYCQSANSATSVSVTTSHSGTILGCVSLWSGVNNINPSPTTSLNTVSSASSWSIGGIAGESCLIATFAYPLGSNGLIFTHAEPNSFGTAIESLGEDAWFLLAAMSLGGSAYGTRPATAGNPLVGVGSGGGSPIAIGTAIAFGVNTYTPSSKSGTSQLFGF